MSTTYCIPAADTNVRSHEDKVDLNHGALLVDLIFTGMLLPRDYPGGDGAASPPEQHTATADVFTAAGFPVTTAAAAAHAQAAATAAAAAAATSSSSSRSDHGGTSAMMASEGGTSRQMMPSSDSRHARSERPLPLPPDDSIIAHSPSTTGPPSQHTPPLQQQQLLLQQQRTSQQALTPTRRAACTHVRLTRIYGPYKCHHCGRVPRLGWVYRCTQDFGENLVGFNHRSEDTFTSALQRRLQQESEVRSQLPQIAEAGEHEEQDPETRLLSRSTATSVILIDRSASPPPRVDSPGPRLKDWMYDLRGKGCYTEEQIAVLKLQRQTVLDCVAASAYPEPPEQSELQDVLIADPITLTPGPSSSYYNRRYRRPYIYAPSRNRSTTIAPYWPMPSPPRRSEEEIPRGRQQTGPGVSLFGPHGMYTPSDNQIQHGELQQPSVCVYQACSTCRSAMRDRSWQCLHPQHFASLGEDMQLPDPAIDNRIMSHPDLIRSAHYKVFHPELAPDPMSNSMYTTGDFGDDHDYDDDDDFDLTTSGYDSSEISPDASSEGTPTMQFYDEQRGWDRFAPWMAPAPTPPSAPLGFGQVMPTPSVTYGNPLSGYGPAFYGQRRILRRASSMDPRLLRSAREMAEMADIGLVGLGLGTNMGASNNRPSSAENRTVLQRDTQHAAAAATATTAAAATGPPELADNGSRSGVQDDTLQERNDEEEEQQALEGDRFNRSGAVSALDLRPSIDEQLEQSFPAPGGLTPEAGEELHVQDGIAVTEEAVETGEADVIMEAQLEAPVVEDRVAMLG